MESSYGSVAGLDVHKKSVVVVVLRGDQPGEDQATGIFGTTRFGLNELITFLRQHGVRDVAMESTAQYWRSVWLEQNLAASMSAQTFQSTISLEHLLRAGAQ